MDRIKKTLSEVPILPKTLYVIPNYKLIKIETRTHCFSSPEYICHWVDEETKKWFENLVQEEVVLIYDYDLFCIEPIKNAMEIFYASYGNSCFTIGDPTKEIIEFLNVSQFTDIIAIVGDPMLRKEVFEKKFQALNTI